MQEESLGRRSQEIPRSNKDTPWTQPRQRTELAWQEEVGEECARPWLRCMRVSCIGKYHAIGSIVGPCSPQDETEILLAGLFVVSLSDAVIRQAVSYRESISQGTLRASPIGNTLCSMVKSRHLP